MGSMLFSESRIEKGKLLAKAVRKTWRQYRRNLPGMIGLSILSAFVIMAIFGPMFLHKYTELYEPNSNEWAAVNPQYAPPSSDYWFGTDWYGRDVFTLTIIGSRASLIVGILASIISISLGTVIGVSAGYFGRVSDEFLMRFTDFFLVIPWFPFMIVMSMLLGRSFTNVIIVIGIVSWPSTARIVRAQVLTVKEKGFVERARCVGSGGARIISKHILPNVFPLIFANTILLIANSIFSESFLDYFGLGDPDVISWGWMLDETDNYGAFNSKAWWWIAAPGTCIVMLIMAFYLVGDAVDEVLNPKLRRR